MNDREGLEKLAPCPFCGGKAANSVLTPGEIGCCNCTATTSTLEEWNRRALLAPREEELGLREACEELKRHAQPYEDESGIIKISLGYWADFLSALAVRPVEGDRNGN